MFIAILEHVVALLVAVILGLCCVLLAFIIEYVRRKLFEE